MIVDRLQAVSYLRIKSRLLLSLWSEDRAVPSCCPKTTCCSRTPRLSRSRGKTLDADVCQSHPPSRQGHCPPPPLLLPLPIFTPLSFTVVAGLGWIQYMTQRDESYNQSTKIGLHPDYNTVSHKDVGLV